MRERGLRKAVIYRNSSRLRCSYTGALYDYILGDRGLIISDDIPIEMLKMENNNDE